MLASSSSLCWICRVSVKQSLNYLVLLLDFCGKQRNELIVSQAVAAVFFVDTERGEVVR